MKDVLPLVILLIVAFLFLVQILTFARIGRVERMLRLLVSSKPVDRGNDVTQHAKVSKKSHRQGAFDQFIEEDLQRKQLTKREQAEAFRDWRKQRGITWQSGDADEED